MVQTLSKGALFVQSITLFHVIGIITFSVIGAKYDNSSLFCDDELSCN